MHFEIRVVERNGRKDNNVLTSEFSKTKALTELAAARSEFPHCRIVLTVRDKDNQPVVIA